MNQITRCPFCETSFRVVADQLRISDGWVRCGQCKKVFDATEYLQTIEPAPLLPEMPLDKLRPPPAPHRTPETVRVWGRPAPIPVSPPSPAAAPEPAATPAAESAQAQPPAMWDVPPVPAFLAAQAPPPAIAENTVVSSPAGEQPAAEPPAAQAPVTAAPEEETPTLGDTASGRPSRHGSRRSSSSSSSSSRRRKRAREPSPSISPLTLLSEWKDDPALDTDGNPLAEPEFVKVARRGAFWRKPSVRAVLLLILLLLLGVLALQVALQERDTLAARYPALRPALTSLCARLGCALQAPRNISAVVVDSSQLLKTRDDAPTYQFQVSIKNTSATAVAMPAVELTLTDSQNQTLLRKVLLRQDLSAPAELAGGQTWNGSMLLRVSSGAAQVAGYSVLAFYP